MKTKLFLKMYSRTAVRLCCCCCLLLLLAGCEKEEEGKQDEPKSAACDITGFTVDGTPWSISGTTITYTYPPETDATQPLKPVITVSPGATVTPASGAAQHFFTAQGVTYVVTAEDGKTTKTYTAKATRTPYTACDIVTFEVDGTPWNISGATITYTYPPETAATTLTPVISVSPGATVTPASGAAQNFFTAQGVTYVVTAEDGVTKKTYMAKAAIALRTACDMVTFEVDGTPWDISGTTITYTYPPETTATTLTPVITVSPGATVTPASGAAQNFFTAQGVTYVVTAEDGATKKTYVAKAAIALRTTCDITGFTVNGTPWNISGTTITYTYPPETDETQPLTPTITVSPGATVTPASGIAQNFFTDAGVTYVVTAEDGTTKKTYVAKATRTPSSACDITGFTVSGTAWNISGTTITYTYPPETDETQPLTPVITVSPGATVTPASGAAQNFFTDAGVTYTVTAEDGTTKKTYVAKATRTPSSACDITGFTVSGTAWNISGTTITYTYPPETDETQPLTPTITVSPGATVTPASGIAQNFFTDAGVTYTVTAEDGATKKTYTARAIIRAVATGVTGACTWTITGATGNYTLTISGSGAMADYTTSYYNVHWYDFRSGIKTLVIQDGVTTIGSYAFSYYSGLTSVTLGNSVTTIGERAFISCTGLTGALNIPNSVTTIGEAAFADCSGLTSVTIPNSVETIGNGAFSGCSGLTGTLTIPNSVTTIGSYAFYGCSGLTSVTLGNSVTTIGSYAFYGCSGLTGALTIPNSVTTIGERAFYNCSGLTGALTLPNSVTTIGYRAFYGCTGLTSVTIGNSVTTIGIGAFYGCTGLTSVTIPNSVTTIGEAAFADCSGLTSVTIPNSVTTIGSSAFSGCTGLTGVTIPNSVTSIGEWAFSGCSGLTSVTFGNSVTSVGEWAFSGCTGVREISINSNVPFNNFSFHSLSALTTVIIGNSVTTIGERAFSGCTGLTSVTIPNSVTTIGGDAFYNCTGLTSVTIPNSVTSIGEWAFADCDGLTGVTIPNSVTTIGSYAFYSCSGLTSVTLGNSVTTIGSYAFYNCRGLTGTLTIPNSVTTIGEYAFYYCTGFTGTLTLGNSVTTIDYGAFSGCTGLPAINVDPDNPAYSAADGVLFNKNKTTLVAYPAGKTGEYAIPNSVTSIGAYAFSGCSGLTSVTIPNSVTSIGAYAFSDCTGLTSVTIPNSVTTIGSFAFRNCTGLTSVSIGNSVTDIGEFTFWGCIDLNAVTCYCITPPNTWGTFNDVNLGNASLRVPFESVKAYKAADTWKDFGTITGI